MRNKEIEEAIETYEKLHADIKFTDEDYKNAIGEAKAQIEYHKNLNDMCCFMTDTTTLKALLSLIEKQQGEIEHYKNKYEQEQMKEQDMINQIQQLEEEAREIELQKLEDYYNED